jgi:hypothetical protein
MAAVGCVGTAQAAEKIRYEEIPRGVSSQGEATVLTIDGAKHEGAKFRLDSDQVVLYRKDGSIENLPVDQIVRLSFKAERKHYFEFTVLSAAAAVVLPYWVCDGDLVCAVLAGTVISPAAIVVAAGSAPVTLALDGMRLLIPPKVYEIVH